MNLSQLYYYRTLTEVGSYKKAAAELYISEPTLSLAIKRLESELGCDLLQHRRNVIQLTPDGEEFARVVNQVLDLLDSEVATLKNRADQQRGVLRIGVPINLPDANWTRLLSEYHASCEPTRTRTLVLRDTSEQLLAALKNGETDLILAAIPAADDPAFASIPAWSLPAAPEAADASDGAGSETQDEASLWFTYRVQRPKGDTVLNRLIAFINTYDFAS